MILEPCMLTTSSDGQMKALDPSLTLACATKEPTSVPRSPIATAYYS